MNANMPTLKESIAQHKDLRELLESYDLEKSLTFKAVESLIDRICSKFPREEVLKVIEDLSLNLHEIIGENKKLKEDNQYLIKRLRRVPVFNNLDDEMRFDKLMVDNGFTKPYIGDNSTDEMMNISDKFYEKPLTLRLM